MSIGGITFGTILEVYPPNHKNNISKFQYEYLVSCANELQSSVESQCVKADMFTGGIFNYSDVTLGVGYTVFVAFPLGDTSTGVIMGCSRKEASVMPEEGGIRHKQRFNDIESYINHAGEWGIGYVSADIPVGPNVKLTKDDYTISDGGTAGDGSDAQSVLIDRVGGKITINSGDWDLTVNRQANINVTGDLNISCANAKVESKGDVEVKATNAKVDAKLNVEVKAGIQAKVNAKFVKLNADGIAGQVLTTATQPVCYVTGIPFIGSFSVLAGS